MISKIINVDGAVFLLKDISDFQSAIIFYDKKINEKTIENTNWFTKFFGIYSTKLSIVTKYYLQITTLKETTMLEFDILEEAQVSLDNLLKQLKDWELENNDDL